MKRQPKSRNPIASALKSPHLKPKVKPNKKVYKRKSRTLRDAETKS